MHQEKKEFQHNSHKANAHHKSQDYGNSQNFNLITPLNLENISFNNFRMNNSTSSHHLFENNNSFPQKPLDKDFNNTLKESRNLLSEYKDNLMKFDSNINEIKNALNILKMSLINYKSQTEIEEEILSQGRGNSPLSLPDINQINNKFNEIDEKNANFLNKPPLEEKNLRRIEYEGDCFYEGEAAEDNKKHGIGQFFFSEKNFYVGEWENDEISGFGLLFQNDQLIYEGFWEKAHFSGKGILYNIFANNDKNEDFEVDFKDFHSIEDQWIKYKGEFYNDCKHGKGKIFFANGEAFFGNFKENIIDGLGVFIKKEKSEIVFGLWKDNLFIKLQEN